jgi:hypothetical protein
MVQCETLSFFVTWVCYPLQGFLVTIPSFVLSVRGLEFLFFDEGAGDLL